MPRVPYLPPDVASVRSVGVVLGDRGFCSYANLALLVERGAHAVMRAHQMRQLDYRQGKGLGSYDRIVT